VARPPAALEIGRRVFICAPSARHREEFVTLMKVSRRALSPWVAALRARASGVPPRGPVIAGVINVSQIFHGNFRSAYLGYYAGAPFMGQGYMSEGLRLVLRHAFGTLGLHRLEADIQPRNRDSIRLVRCAGFQREGFSPRYLKILGRWRDHERRAIIAEAFRR
jgi:ribosomal-protein-alanine N-acetyltransferase